MASRNSELIEQSPSQQRIGRPAVERPPYSVPTLTRRQAGFLLALAIGSLAVSFVFERLVGGILPFQPAAIRTWLEAWGPLAPVFYIALMVLAIVITPIPSVPLDIAAGLAFGLWWGTVYTLIGAEFGALLAFWLARRFGRTWLLGRLGTERMAAIDRLAERAGGKALILMRLIPAFNFDWVSYAAGLTAIPLRTFAVATFLGMALPVVAIVAVGDSLLSHPGRAAVIFVGLLIAYATPLLWWLATPRSIHRRRRLPSPAERERGRG